MLGNDFNEATFDTLANSSGTITSEQLEEAIRQSSNSSVGASVSAAPKGFFAKLAEAETVIGIDH
jgi:hypothetical protein